MLLSTADISSHIEIFSILLIISINYLDNKLWKILEFFILCALRIQWSCKKSLFSDIFHTYEDNLYI